MIYRFCYKTGHRVPVVVCQIVKYKECPACLKKMKTIEPMASTKRDEKIDFLKIPLNMHNKRLQYKLNRKKQLAEIDKIPNNMGDGEHDIELYSIFKPFRDRANELL